MNSMYIDGPFNMSAYLAFRIALSLLIAAVVGCSAQKFAAAPTADTKERRPPAGFRIDSQSSALGPGDRIAVWFQEAPPVEYQPVLLSIAEDGAFRFGGATFHVAGLTPKEAASSMQVQLMTNFIGPVFSVTVMRVQPNGAADGSQPVRAGTGGTAAAAGCRR